jgi:hypothetical protein
VPALTYPTGDFQPFTKILSSEVNGKFNAIKTLLNTTGLDSTNIQVGGVARNRLAVGTVKAIVINATSDGAMSELAPVNNGAVYFNASGVPTAGTLPTLSGGTGLSYTPTLADAEKVLQINTAGNAFTVAAAPLPPTLKIFSFYHFS